MKFFGYVLIISSICASSIAAQQASVFRCQPYIQDVNQRSVTVLWAGAVPAKPSIEWGKTSKYGQTTSGFYTALENGEYLCATTISNLEPQTTYHYRAICGGTATTADATFTTAPYRNTPFTFAVWGDSQTEVPANKAMFAQMASNVDFAVAVGDVVQDATFPILENPFKKYVCNILGHQKPFYVAFGNHDGSTETIVHKFVKNRGQGSFSFNYGNAHFTCIDYSQCNNATMTNDGWISSLPLNWLKTDLASDDSQRATWRFVFIHVPPYSGRWIDGSYNLRQYLVPLLKQYNVHICFSGHVHEYERGYIDGIYYVITGCGSYLDLNEPTFSWLGITAGGIRNIGPFKGGCFNGYTSVEIDSNKLTCKMHAFKPNGKYCGVVDEFKITQPINYGHKERK